MVARERVDSQRHRCTRPSPVPRPLRLPLLSPPTLLACKQRGRSVKIWACAAARSNICVDSKGKKKQAKNKKQNASMPTHTVFVPPGTCPRSPRLFESSVNLGHLCLQVLQRRGSRDEIGEVIPQIIHVPVSRWEHQGVARGRRYSRCSRYSPPTQPSNLRH